MSVERILLPTDGSPASEAAAERAIELARESGADLHVLHVLELLALPFGHGEALRTTLASEAAEFVDGIVARAKDAGVGEVDGTVRKGRPYETILGVAEERGCDLIVMGSSGRARHPPDVLGSVTARVLQHSPVEVLVVPTRGPDG